MPKYVYYDGIGAKKSGKHTVKEFLNITNLIAGFNTKQVKKGFPLFKIQLNK